MSTQLVIYHPFSIYTKWSLKETICYSLTKLKFFSKLKGETLTSYFYHRPGNSLYSPVSVKPFTIWYPPPLPLFDNQIELNLETSAIDAIESILVDPNTPFEVKSYYQVRKDQHQTRLSKEAESLAIWICGNYPGWSTCHFGKDFYDGTQASDNHYNPVKFKLIFEIELRQQCKIYQLNYETVKSKLHLGYNSSLKFKNHMYIDSVNWGVITSSNISDFHQTGFNDYKLKSELAKVCGIGVSYFHKVQLSKIYTNISNWLEYHSDYTGIPINSDKDMAEVD